MPASVPQESALQLAKEQYAFCADIVEQGAPGMTVGKLVADLKNATVWYFWWD